MELRLAYGGPRGSGKTTNLRFIETAISHGDLSSVVRTSVSSIGKSPIDFLSFELESSVSEKVCFRITGLPPPDDYRYLWKMILNDCDGIVMVLDSQLESLEENRSSLCSLLDVLSAWRRDVELMPVVLQFNKSDLPGALPAEVLDRRINTIRKESLVASAVQGEGVLETFMTISNLLLKSSSIADSTTEWLGRGTT